MKAVDSKLRSYPWNYKKQLLIHAHQKRFYKIIIKKLKWGEEVGTYTRATTKQRCWLLLPENGNPVILYRSTNMISRELRRKALNLWKSFLGM